MLDRDRYENLITRYFDSLEKIRNSQLYSVLGEELQKQVDEASTMVEGKILELGEIVGMLEKLSENF
jgi:hypothetical protein